VGLNREKKCESGLRMSRALSVLAVITAVSGLITGDLIMMYDSLMVSALAIFMEGFENGSS
jgi:hypothetical protein